MNDRAMNMFTTEEMADMLDWLAAHVKEMKLVIDGSNEWIYSENRPKVFYALVETHMEGPIEDDDEDYVTEYEDEHASLY